MGCKDIIPKQISYRYDMTSQGWELLEDAQEPKEIDIEKIVFISLRDESLINGWVLKLLAKKHNANFGRLHIESLLKQSVKFPEILRDYELLFPGTIWMDKNGDPHMPYLFWGKYSWKAGFKSVLYEDEIDEEICLLIKTV